MPSRNRGKPKPKLRDLSVNPLTHEEVNALIDAVGAASTPIAVAILGAVLVEHELEASLRGRLRLPDDKIWEEMVDERGPLSTLARKIAIGHALRLYDPAFRDNLHIVRSVRNAFAHSKRLIDFNHPLVSREIKKIKMPKRQRRKFRNIAGEAPQHAYVTLCLRLVSTMIEKRTTAMRRSTKRRRAKLATSPFHRALAPVLGLGGIGSLGTLGSSGGLVAGFPLASIGSTLQSSPARQTGDPKTSGLGGLLGKLPRKPAKLPHNEDK
jgi:hypothetical protein